MHRMTALPPSSVEQNQAMTVSLRHQWMKHFIHRCFPRPCGIVSSDSKAWRRLEQVNCPLKFEPRQIILPTRINRVIHEYHLRSRHDGR